MEKVGNDEMLQGLEAIERVSSSALREKFKDVVGKALYQKQPTIITHYRKDAAAVVPLEMVASELRKVATPATEGPSKKRTLKRRA